MQQGWKSAALGGAVGAVAAIAIMGGALAFHLVPVASDARLRSFLLANPKLIYEMQAKAEADAAAEEALATQKAVDKIGQKALLDPAVGYVTGPANAKNTFVEFYDYNCGHCRNTSAAVKKFYEAHKHDTRFSFIEFPIFGAQSQMAARAAVAARKQGDKALALHFALMSEGKQAVDQEVLLKAARDVGIDVMKLSADLTAPETDKAMLASARLAREAQFSGTPMFIINGKVHAGEITEDEIKALMKS